MALETMYPPQNNGVRTQLSSAINSAATSITVDDASVLPAAPNILSLGGGDDTELVKMTAVNGSILIVERGFNGTTPKDWEAETYVYRAIQAQDVSALQYNIAEVAGEVADHVGETNNPHQVSYSQAGAAPAAAGVPSGGTSGQVLTKTGSGFGWADAAGGDVQSVDGVSPDVSGNVGLGAIRYNVDQSLTLTDAEKAQARANIGLITSGAYGVRWNSASSSPLLTRLGASAQFADPVAALGAGLGSSPFDSILPWSGMRECNRASNAVTAYKGDANFSRSNDTYVEIPKFYYKCTRDGNNHDYYISSDPAEGFVVHPAFIVGGVIRDNIYVGRYNTVAGHVSKTNTAPLVSITRASFRSGAAAKGANNSQFTVAAYEAIKLLYLVEYANWNIQATIGYGHTNTANTAAVPTGKTDMMLYHTGTSASSRTADSNCNIQYRWIEGLYGNVWQFLDGVNVYANKPYYNLNCTSFADDTSTGYTATSYTLGSTNGYVTALGFDPANPWLQEPVAVGGSETTYLCDYFYQDASGWRLVLVGGHWADGLAAGFYWNSNNASSVSSAFVGGRLLAA